MVTIPTRAPLAVAFAQRLRMALQAQSLILSADEQGSGKPSAATLRSHPLIRLSPTPPAVVEVNDRVAETRVVTPTGAVLRISITVERPADS